MLSDKEGQDRSRIVIDERLEKMFPGLTDKLTKKQQKWLFRIILGAIGFVALGILEHVGAFDDGR